MSMKEKIGNFYDGIASLTNSLINKRSHSSNNVIVSSRVSWEELRAMYESGIGQKILGLKIGAALDDTLIFANKDDESFYNNRLAQHVKLAAKFMLAFGRGLLVMYRPGADLSKPMQGDFDVNTLRYQVFSGDIVYIHKVNYDLASPDYFKPTSYFVRDYEVHPSWVVDFTYIKPVEFRAAAYFFGGISEFQLIRDAVINDQIISRAIPRILETSSTIFYKLQGFRSLMSAEMEGEVVKYFGALENMRSIYGAGIADKDDDIISLAQSVTNLADVDMISIRRLAMVSNIPVSALIEENIFYRAIRNLQSDYLLDRINRLLRMHGMDPASFDDNQSPSPTETAQYEAAIINNAVSLHNMNENYSEYLRDKGILQQDADDFWPADDEEGASDEASDNSEQADAIQGA
jgi:hypothetical protein